MSDVWLCKNDHCCMRCGIEFEKCWNCGYPRPEGNVLDEAVTSPYSKTRHYFGYFVLCSAVVAIFWFWLRH